MVNMHGAKLGTTVQRRYRLARVQDFQRIETLAQRMELVTFRVAELDDETARDLRSIIFSTDSDSLHFPDGLDRATAAILLEVMKDMLHQSYVRYGRLRKALKMRQLFADPDSAEESAATKVTSLRSKLPTGTG